MEVSSTSDFATTSSLSLPPLTSLSLPMEEEETSLVLPQQKEKEEEKGKEGKIIEYNQLKNWFAYLTENPILSTVKAKKETLNKISIKPVIVLKTPRLLNNIFIMMFVHSEMTTYKINHIPLKNSFEIKFTFKIPFQYFFDNPIDKNINLSNDMFKIQINNTLVNIIDSVSYNYKIEGLSVKVTKLQNVSFTNVLFTKIILYYNAYYDISFPVWEVPDYLKKIADTLEISARPTKRV
jgi:hypothetical protein